MQPGGIGVSEVAGAAIAFGIIGWVFVEVVTIIARDLERAIDASLDDDELRAAAFVPEYAAARRAPDYAGRCRCRRCRVRPQEPCQRL
jgi:hypothetical protein